MSPNEHLEDALAMADPVLDSTNVHTQLMIYSSITYCIKSITAAMVKIRWDKFTRDAPANRRAALLERRDLCQL